MTRIVAILSIALLLGSDENTTATDVVDEDWSIDTNNLRQGCYGGSDCIPSLEHPEKSSVDGSSLAYLNDSERVVGIWNGSEYIAYPHSILDWHEIVNESGYVISYCPLTGSAIHFDSEGEFGVSGLLNNSNLIMYDRTTNSFWPQMLLLSAAGERTGQQIALNNLVETSWGTWKRLFPSTLVVNSETGYGRDYDRYPYGGYKSCNSSACNDFIYFPIGDLDTRLKAKDRVLVLIAGEESKAMSIPESGAAELITVSLGNVNHQVFLSGDDHITVAFESSKNLFIKTWNPGSGLIEIGEVSTDNAWDLTGRNLVGDQENLTAANAFIAFWFSVAAYYPNVELLQ